MAQRAELESMEWPAPTAERPIKVAYFKRLHAVDPKTPIETNDAIT